MRLVVDAQIPLAERLFGDFGTVSTMPGEAISSEVARGADVLLVRSVTRVDESLLAESNVRFVGSATIGTDHVDRAYLDQRGITFAHAPASNAGSVAEYVIASLLAVFVSRGEPLRGRTAAVVGLGSIGSRVAERLEALGLTVFRNDPPLARSGVQPDHRPLSELLDAVDVLTLHVPLTMQGPDATWHLIDETALAAIRRDAVLMNTSRGAVVDDRALFEALGRGSLRDAVLDVWEDEPAPATDLVAAVSIATPHIAGYSYDGKVAGALMLGRALSRWAGRRIDPGWREVAPPSPLLLETPAPTLGETEWLDTLVRQMYDVRADDQKMRSQLSGSVNDHRRRFHELRATYPERRSFEWYRIDGPVPAGCREALTDGLRVRLTHADQPR